MKKILIYALISVIAVAVGLSVALHDAVRDRDRYKANQASLLGDVEYYRTENARNAASVQKLTLTVDELRRNYGDLCRTADDLNVKLKRIQSTATTATRTEVKVVTVIKDSVVYRDGQLDSMLVFNWRDPWVDVSGSIRRDSVDLGIHSTDTLVQIVHRVPHKFWFIKWGTKAIRQEVVSTNPHTKITYSEYIELKK